MATSDTPHLMKNIFIKNTFIVPLKCNMVAFLNTLNCVGNNMAQLADLEEFLRWYCECDALNLNAQCVQFNDT